MWMRRRRAGAAVLAAATVLLSASTSPPAGRPTDAHLRPTADLTALALVAVPAQYSFDDLAPTEAGAREYAGPPALVLAGPRMPPRPPRTGAHGSSPAAGTPQAVLAAAYRKAVSGSPKSCHLRVEHLAAIGQVESGSIGGRSVTSAHRVAPAIYGPLLDGGPFAVVHDSDGGGYDGDGQYDRAMGPLQFLPGTWRWAGRDGDGDGRRDPQNVFDAALATAGYLCLGGRDLSHAGDLRSAVLSYNQSGQYHSAVLEWVSYFRQHGLAALTSVAFRVGSGGRASALAELGPDADQAADQATGPAKATPTKTPAKQPPPTATDTPTAPVTTSPSTTPTQPSPPPTTPPTTTPIDPTPEPTIPAPTTTTPPPASSTPSPPDPEPSPAG
ncbi:lytic murein transglycosylase [Pedococcus sp. P5_B7]